MGLQAKITQTLTRLMGLNMLMGLAMLTLFAGLLLLAAAAYMAMAMVLASALAALFTGLGLLAVFGLLAALCWPALRSSSATADTDAQPQDDNAVEQQLRPLIGDRAANWTHNNTEIVVAGALVTGVALAASPALRHFLLRTLGPLVTRQAINTLRDSSEQ